MPRRLAASFCVGRDRKRSCGSCFFAYHQLRNGAEYRQKRVEVYSRLQPVTNNRVSEDIVLDVGKGEKIIGIEIMNASRKVDLIQSEEGYSISCPSLWGCHSQGATMVEAFENIKSAIREWLDAHSEEKSKFSVIEPIVTV